MADKLYFSRDTRVLVRIQGKNHSFEIPVLDGYSFSQATNSSEITLNEMADSDGNSRRARQMFNDSFAPAEWSFSTYAQPFYSAGTDQSAVEAPLWALLAGKAESTSTDSTKGKFRGVSTDPTTQYAGASSDKWSLDFNQSNKTSLGVADIYFIMGAVNPSASDTILAYKISGCCVNEVSMDFDMEGMATLNWSGMGKEIVEEVITKGTTSPAVAGNLWYNTTTDGFNIIDDTNSGTTVATTKIESDNFIKNRLTKLTASQSSGTSSPSTNLLNQIGTFETDLSEDEWSNANANVTAIDLNQIAAPFDTGTNTADFVRRTNSGAGVMALAMDLKEAGEGRISVSGTTRYLFSAYVKRHVLSSPRYLVFETRKNVVGPPQERKGVVLDWNPTSSSQLPTFLTWTPPANSNGNTGSTNVTNQLVTDEGNGWYRVSFITEAPTPSVTGLLPQVFMITAGNTVALNSDNVLDTTAIGTQGAGFYLAGFMVEPTSVGTTPSSTVAYNGQTIAGGGTTNYDLTITGGNVTISNNVTFLTPETLGQINKPLGHVTGTRNISGSFTCYLNEDGTSSANLFESLVSSNEVTNDFNLSFGIGDAGVGNQLPRVELNLANCHLEVPTHSIEDVISIETNFHALPTNINGKDELTVKYVADES